MSSKDRETKTIQEKLKQFFRLSKGAAGNSKSKVDFSLSEDIERDISRDAPIQIRTKAIRDLSEHVLTNRLEDKAIEKLWRCLEDLLQRDQPRDLRHLTFTFFRCLLQGQYERLGVMRAHFFRVLKQHDHPEDTIDRFELLATLTFNGKDLLYFEEEVGPFLLGWMNEVTAAGRTQDYLALLVNVIKFNAAYMDEEVIAGLVQGTCQMCCRMTTPAESAATVPACLLLLDTIVCYSNLPTESLATFIGALCRTVNREEYCQNSWRIMRNLLGTHMGHSALYTMCRILQEPSFRHDHLLLRGAVFHVNQALWGTRAPLASLHCTPTSVLPSFLHALQSDHAFVVYEVTLSVQGLVNRRGTELHDPAWDTLLDIVEAVIAHVDGANHPPDSPVVTHLHDTLCSMERLTEQGRFNGSVIRLYGLVERCARSRPEPSVMRLVDYLYESVVPTKHMWLCKLNELLHRYFRQETRTNVRLRVLDRLAHVLRLNRLRYEDELIERIVVPHLQHIASDSDAVIRKSSAELLVNLCLECDSKRCGELLDILERLLARPFETYESGSIPLNDADVMDVKTVVCGLVRIFTIRVHRLPSTHAVRAYKMLMGHLEAHYVRPSLFENASHVRYQIFSCFLKVRANSSCQLGCPDGAGVFRYSPYVCVHNAGRGPVSPPPPSPAATAGVQPATPLQVVTSQPSTNTQVTHVSLRHAFKVFITCLTQEKDWEVLQLVLREIPNVMQNKALVLSKQHHSGGSSGEIDQLANALCSLLTDKSLCLPETLRNAPKVSRSDFQLSVLPALASLATYHAHLDPACQQRVVRCMVKFGLMTRCSHQCITALMTCVLEMQEVMVKLLPGVLLDLSKISATVHIAVPVLEFLSTLTRLPTVFGNFVGDQYMAVFAISLPYTNPFKYNHYIVSLAHHVIAVWFLKCRLPFRKDFVRFITTGLQTNALVPFEETTRATSDLNEDSSNRKRSSSLTEQGSRRRDRPPTASAAMDLRPPMDRALHTFYEELTETCIDLMARYTFSPCSALPKRLPTAEFLLSGGQSMSWLLGNKLITVTTSGCAQKALRHGLCDKCWVMCKSALHRSLSGDESPAVAAAAVSDGTSPEPPPPPPPTPPPTMTCSCWCQAWAEIHVRRPTGDMSWVMRIQNQISQQLHDFPLNELSTLFMHSLIDKENRVTDKQVTQETTPVHPVQPPIDPSPVEHVQPLRSDSAATSEPISIPESRATSRQNSKDESGDESDTAAASDNYYEDGNRTRNPVRRSNSSPEMSASWKNPFMQQHQQHTVTGDTAAGDVPTIDDVDGQKKNKKDMRVSCEAIPEEISGQGTTPPAPQPPLLLSSHSCPGDSGVSSKPPQSPAPVVPAVPMVPTVPGVSTKKGAVELAPMRRERVHTISVMSPAPKPSAAAARRHHRDAPKSGINPSFVFLQLYHAAHFGSGAEKPLLVGPGQMVQRAVKILDCIPPYETHKVGVVYVARGQCSNETDILGNRHGSVRYVDFLRRLGTLLSLREADPQTCFLGGLEQNGNDGKFAYIWQDDVMQVIFHVATLMPCKDSDPLYTNKKMHIGNNYVTIVYNESGEEFNIGTIKGQFNYANIIIQPLEHATNRVLVKAKDELAEYVGHTEPKIISDQNLAVLARQMALHANLASMVTRSLKAQGQDPYASNWLERLRKIKHLRARVLQEHASSSDLYTAPIAEKRIQDFTEYT